MSATYKLIGKRNLRKYTASKATPVYAAESEVSVLSKNLCNVEWTPVSQKDAGMTYHTNEIVHYDDPVEKTGGVTGLDYNVVIRDGFDAALFCGGHENELHRVYGNAACYRFVLPDMQTYPTLEKLKVNVTSDPYNSTGARIAVYTNSTGVIPTECATCRQGSAPSQSHSCTKAQGSNDWTTNDTYADAVAPREARQTTSGGKTSTSWHPVNGTCEFDPTGGLQLQKYLFVFVLLENYNVCRGNWVEGCSFIENLVTVTTSSAVSAWDSRVSGGESVLDVSGDDGSAYGGIDILKASGFTQVVGSGRKYVIAESPLCGIESPERKSYLGVNGSSNAPGLWYASSPSLVSSLSGKVVGCSPMSISYVSFLSQAQTLPSGNTSKMWSGGVIATYNPNNDKSGNMPGFSLYLALYPTSGGTTAYDVIPISASFVQAAAPVAAKDMLASGSVRRIFVIPAFSWFNQQSVPAIRATMDRIAFLVVLASDSQTEILGYLVNKGYKTSASVSDGWAMYSMTNEDSFGEYGLVACAYPRIRIRDFINSAMKAYGTGGLTFDDDAGTLTFASDTEVPSKVMFYAWRLTVADHNVLIQSNKAGVIGCYGENVSVEPAGPFGSIAGKSAFSTVVVSGKLERVGTTECSNVAYVDMYPSESGVATEGYVTVPEFDSVLSPVGYDNSFRVIPVQRTTSGDAEIGIDAIVTSRSGIRVGSSVANAAIVSGTEVSEISTPLNSCLAFAFAPDKFRSLVVGYSEYSSVMYGTTQADTLLQTSDPGSAAIGLRNCVGRMYDGKTSEVSAPGSVNPFVNFTVTPTSVSKLITSDFGLTSQTVSFPVWRVCSSYILVPFTVPPEGSFVAKVLRMSWSTLANCTPGSKFNVWVRKGVRVSGDDESLRDFRLFTAQCGNVGEWTLLGSVPAYGKTSGEVDVSGKLESGSGNTLLLTAWCPYDTYNPSAPLPTRIGVGTLDVDPDAGTIVGSESSGWRPNIVLM